MLAHEITVVDWRRDVHSLSQRQPPSRDKCHLGGMLCCSRVGCSCDCGDEIARRFLPRFTSLVPGNPIVEGELLLATCAIWIND